MSDDTRHAPAAAEAAAHGDGAPPPAEREPTDVDAALRALRALRVPARPPLGMEARLLAGVRRDRRRSIGEERLVVASVVCALAAFAGDVRAVLVAACAAGTYAWLSIPARRRARGR